MGICDTRGPLLARFFVPLSATHHHETPPVLLCLALALFNYGPADDDDPLDLTCEVVNFNILGSTCSMISFAQNLDQPQGNSASLALLLYHLRPGAVVVSLSQTMEFLPPTTSA
jgi:hypothetical protein